MKNFSYKVKIASKADGNPKHTPLLNYLCIQCKHFHMKVPIFFLIGRMIQYLNPWRRVGVVHLSSENLYIFFRIRLSADCAITKAVADMYPDNFVQDLEMLLWVGTKLWPWSSDLQHYILHWKESDSSGTNVT